MKKLPKWHNPRLSKIAGIIYITYFIILIPCRYYIKGMGGIYDLLWCCNQALLVAGIGCLLQSSTIIGSAIVLVAFPHLSWNLDVIFYYTLGFFPFGTASYISWPETTYIELITTLHHIWFLPLLFYVLRKNGNLPWSLLLHSYIYIVVLVTVSRYVTPKYYEGLYLNVNMAHEFWKDVAIPVLKTFDNSPFIIYLIFLLLFCNALNAIGFAFYKFCFDRFINSKETMSFKKIEKKLHEE